MESRPRQTVEQRSKFGKSLRKQAPRTSHGQWCPASARPDPIGLLEEGDIIAVDIAKRKLDVRVSDGEMAERKKKWKPEPSEVEPRSYLARYRKLVTSAHTGAVFE